MKSLKGLVSEDIFWEIIDESIEKYNSNKEQEDYLLNRICGLEEEVIIGITYYSTEFYRKAFTSYLWASVDIVMNGCGDEDFHYFRHWLVRKGKKVYYDALANADNLFDEFSKCTSSNEIYAESLKASIIERYLELKGIDLDEIIYENYIEDYETKSESEIYLILDWEGDNERLREICPNIFNKFRDNPLQ